MAQPIEFFEELKQRLSEVQSAGKYPTPRSSATIPARQRPLDEQCPLLFGLTIGLSDVEMGACLQCSSKFSAVPVTNHLLRFRFCLDAAMRKAGEDDVRRMRDENVVSTRYSDTEHPLLGEELSSLDCPRSNSHLTSAMLAGCLCISHQSDL